LAAFLLFMEVILNELGKKFGREWIFKDLDYTITKGNPIAVVGPNGSGKSTLLQVIAGILPQTKGTIIYKDGSKTIDPYEIYNEISYASPYLELIEEFTLKELIDFHIKFKPLSERFTSTSLISYLMLEKSTNKQIKFFSSGMKQRLKLGLALFGKNNIVLLDEPTSNMDSKGIEWYIKNISEILEEKLIIICSNQTHEYDFCKNILNINNYKN
jgi:ABC-type multidrug transport system ATPase subunit